jgi:hypothetical protein
MTQSNPSFSLPENAYSNWDKYRGTRIPSSPSVSLAEETGIHVGDGSMGVYRGGAKKTRDFQYYVIGDLREDIYYLKGYVKRLLSSLYNIEPVLDVQEWCRSARLRLRSKAIVTFKQNVLGLPIGQKSNVIFPPVFECNPELEASFIRGLTDTDGCLSFADKGHLHNYPRIKITSISRPLLSRLKRILSTDFDLHPILIQDFKSRTTYDRNYPTLFLQIQGRKALDIWNECISFSNISKLSKLLIWETYGFCPPRTSLRQRLAIISGILHPKEFYSSRPIILEENDQDHLADAIRALGRRFGEFASEQICAA